MKIMVLDSINDLAQNVAEGIRKEERVHVAAICIQNKYRAYAYRRAAAVKVQKWWKGRLVRRWWRVYRLFAVGSAKVIQKNFRIKLRAQAA